MIRLLPFQAHNGDTMAIVEDYIITAPESRNLGPLAQSLVRMRHYDGKGGLVCSLQTG
jgi:hypothetical protein